MNTLQQKPSVVLVCHEEDAIDADGLTAWLAASMRLAGVVLIARSTRRQWRAVQRERRRRGLLGLMDVLAFRAYYKLALARADAAWCATETVRLQKTYGGRADVAERIVVDNPNGAEALAFIRRLQPDLMIARCKVLLTRAVFDLPRAGTFALHPGICPEYRNAHGCFWALSRRDRDRVGMSVLRIDRGVDTGPVFLRASYDYDEVAESHIVIQYRVVTENLDAIAATLTRVAAGVATPSDDRGRDSAVWGQPTLSAFRRWKSDATKDRINAARLAAVS